MIWHRSHIGFTEARTFIASGFLIETFEVAGDPHETGSQAVSDGPGAEGGIVATRFRGAKPVRVPVRDRWAPPEYPRVVDTGFTGQDAQTDFNRARRRAALKALSVRLRGQPGDVTTLLPFEEVVDALGRTGERRIGLETIPLDTIVGSVDRADEFDRRFRPRSNRVRARWQRINEAQRQGRGMPPIEAFRVGGLHFVVDGHHRVSVARHLDLEVIEAYVTEITTRVSPQRGLRLADLPAKSHERLFLERVPLSREERGRISLGDPAVGYAELAEAVEAWGFRLIQGIGEPRDRRQVAEAWFRDEFLPVVEALREADLIGRGSDADAYLRVARDRYMLLRTHEWGEDVIARLREALR
jgi:hypothetical protein